VGEKDIYFLPPGAKAFSRDLPDTELHFFDTGHFALETHGPEIGDAMLDFLGLWQFCPSTKLLWNDSYARSLNRFGTLHFSDQRNDVASQTVQSSIDVAWWRGFGDPELSLLVERLAAQNLDLKTAAERIVQARDQREIAASQGLPNLSGSVLANHSRQSENGILRLVQPAPGALAWLVAVPVTARTWAKNMRLRTWAAMLRRFSPDQAGRTSR